MLSLKFALQRQSMLPISARFFKVKSVKRHKFKTPKILRIMCKPIYPPPGLDLEYPEWTPTEYLRRIGGDCEDYGDKFETMDQLFSLDSF